jgi:hypothetical protein
MIAWLVAVAIISGLGLLVSGIAIGLRLAANSLVWRAEELGLTEEFHDLLDRLRVD